MKTLFVNFFGGPCSGKSTISAQLFAKLKWSNISAELISEYAKQLVWEESFPKMRNQIYILGKQHNKQFTLNGKVDVAVTDSPFILSVIYDDNRTKYLREMAVHEFGRFRNLNIFLERAADYDATGRTQKTRKEAVVKDKEIKQFLTDNNITFTCIQSTENAVDEIIGVIKKKLKK